jgi:hypothetical protein
VSAARDNERIKFQAAALDRTSTACFAIGVVGPAAVAAPSIYAFGWMAIAVVLHVAGYRLLGRLQP